ncbi:unnamed protein product, partial [Chrysoparadoxa australica]
IIYRILLADLGLEGPAAGGKWIDRDTLLHLKGAATLAHNPCYLRHTTNLPRVSRGIRIVAPNATHGMQEALARALSHTTGANLVLLDDAALADVRRVAAQEGIPAPFLTQRRLLSTLLELAEEDGQPYVVFLRDKGGAVLNNPGACQAIMEEMRSEDSRVLFLLSTARDFSAHG